MKRWLYGTGIFCATMVMVGCSHWPPVVETTKEIREVSRREQRLRVRGVANVDLDELERFRDLRVLNFASGWAVKPAKITDEGLARLAQLDLPRLEKLNLGYCTNITDAGLAHVGRMHTITWVSFMACPQVTDAGLPHLFAARSLTGLDLRNCPGITDSGLELLASKTNWQRISLGGCENVSSNGVARLQAALPYAAVVKDEEQWKFHQKPRPSRED